MTTTTVVVMEKMIVGGAAFYVPFARFLFRCCGNCKRAMHPQAVFSRFVLWRHQRPLLQRTL
jgi:hypothetical protein